MMNMKKMIAVIAAVSVIGAAGAAFAAEFKTPADIVSGLTGKSVEDLNKERQEGKSYGAIAEENGKLDEFKSQMLEQKKTVLGQRVQEGRLTQEQADEIYSAIENNQANCDGTGSAGIGRKYGAGMGQGQGRGMGRGNGAGMGSGCGLGRGINR